MTNEYKKLMQVNFDDVELEKLADISTIEINSDLSLQQRQRLYLEKIKNPYIVRVGDVKVKIRFSDNGITIEEALQNLILSNNMTISEK